MVLKSAHDFPVKEVERQGMEVANVAENALALLAHQGIFQSTRGRRRASIHEEQRDSWPRIAQLSITGSTGCDCAQTREGWRRLPGQIGEGTGHRVLSHCFLDKVEAKTPIADPRRRGPMI